MLYKMATWIRACFALHPIFLRLYFKVPTESGPSEISSPDLDSVSLVESVTPHLIHWGEKAPQLWWDSCSLRKAVLRDFPAGRESPNGGSGFLPWGDGFSFILERSANWQKADQVSSGAELGTTVHCTRIMAAWKAGERWCLPCSITSLTLAGHFTVYKLHLHSAI